MTEAQVDAEKDLIDSMDKYQRRYAAGFMCGLCHRRADRKGCGALMWHNDNGCVGDVCTPETRAKKLAELLAEFRPKPWLRGKRA